MSVSLLKEEHLPPGTKVITGDRTLHRRNKTKSARAYSVDTSPESVRSKFSEASIRSTHGPTASDVYAAPIPTTMYDRVVTSVGLGVFVPARIKDQKRAEAKREATAELKQYLDVLQRDMKSLQRQLTAAATNVDQAQDYLVSRMKHLECFDCSKSYQLMADRTQLEQCIREFKEILDEFKRAEKDYKTTKDKLQLLRAQPDTTPAIKILSKLSKTVSAYPSLHDGNKEVERLNDYIEDLKDQAADTSNTLNMADHDDDTSELIEDPLITMALANCVSRAKEEHRNATNRRTTRNLPTAPLEDIASQNDGSTDEEGGEEGIPEEGSKISLEPLQS